MREKSIFVDFQGREAQFYIDNLHLYQQSEESEDDHEEPSQTIDESSDNFDNLRNS